MTNAQLIHRIGCPDCDYTGTRELSNGMFDVCSCLVEATRNTQGTLDEDNYMELYGIKN